MSQPSDPKSRVDELFARFARGDPEVEDELYRRIYSDLHERAHHLMAGQRAGHTLQTTALVHEAWVKLRGGQAELSRSAFVRLAGSAMRSVLVDHARARLRDKRGGGARRAELSDSALAVDDSSHASVIALDESLERLRAISPELAQVAELRLFAGLEHQEVAQVLGVSPRTSERSWAHARAWLERELAK